MGYGLCCMPLLVMSVACRPESCSMLATLESEAFGHVGSIDVQTQSLQRQWIANYMPSLSAPCSFSKYRRPRSAMAQGNGYGRLLRASKQERHCRQIKSRVACVVCWGRSHTCHAFTKRRSRYK